ncbi:unnamed protein product [Rotaria sp. Silwood2]|nr:unnamed protein product [Rotaria sp. Silwood2]CAF3993858.1 unnamed protein product [Rotaria sp. Silwood2]
MNPLIGSRHDCTLTECEFNLCETCLPKNKHEHPLSEYLTSKRTYSLEKLFTSIPYLINSNNDEKVETKTLWENDVKSIGFNFPVHWCLPCRELSLRLVELYKEIQTTSNGFRLVFISCDRDVESFNKYRAAMPSLAAPLDAGALFNAYFRISVIPSLFILSSAGTVLSHNDRDDIFLTKGVEVFKTWAQGEKLPTSLPEQFE